MLANRPARKNGCQGNQCGAEAGVREAVKDSVGSDNANQWFNVHHDLRKAEDRQAEVTAT